MEYDHLNYTPPVNKWKQHYQRMANGFTPPNGQPLAAPRAVNSEPPLIPPLPKLVAPAPPARDLAALPVSTTPEHDPPLPPDTEEDLPVPPQRDEDTLPVPPKRHQAPTTNDEDTPMP